MPCFVRRAVPTLLALATAPLAAQQAPAFSDARWERTGDSTRVEQFEGRETLRIETGTAAWRDLQLQDGTIDVDVIVSNRRSFVYLNFRKQAEGEYEEFYLRPHKSTLTDAIQYAPVFQGQSQWQLYYGTRGTAAPRIDAGVWLRLRIVVSGRQAAFFLGDTLTPVMLIAHLAREPRPGGLELRGFIPAGTPGSGPAARFANLRIRPGVVAYDFPPTAATRPLEGIITAWEISDAFAAPDTTLTTLRPEWIAHFTRATVEPDGFVLLHRALKLPAVQRYVGTVARVFLQADNAGTRRLDLGFSDRVTVLLNGRAIFSRDDSYDYENRRDGLISLNQASVYLPLRAGRNEVAVLVTDRFGGWGVMGRVLDRRGLRIGPE